MLRHLNVIGVVCLLFMGMIIILSCNDDTTNTSSIYLISGKHADDVELSTIEDLKNDLGKVVHADIRVVSEGETVPPNASVFILGTPDSNTLIGTMVNVGKLDLTKDNPGPRGGIWGKIDLENNVQAIVIGGSDTQGLQYAIYDYAKEILGVDAL